MRWLFPFALFSALLVVSERSKAETIGATATAQTLGNDQFWQINDRLCSATTRIAATGFVYASASEAAAAISQDYIDWGAKHNYGNCTSTTLRGVRGSFTESTNSGVLFAAVYDGTVLLNSSMQVGGVTKGGSSCPSGWVTSGSNCSRTAYSCPSTGGWTLSGTSCTRPNPPQCPAGEVPGYLGLGCVPDDVCRQMAVTRGPMVVEGNVHAVCDTGCTLRPASFGIGPNGKNVVYPPYVVVAQGPCTYGSTPQSPSVPDLAASAPAAGSCPGTVNGTPVTVACTSTGTVSGTNTVTGSSTPASGAAAGPATSQTVVQTCNGTGACQTVTTTTTTNPDGSTSTSTSTQHGTAPNGTGTGNSGTGTGNGGGGENSSTFGGTCAATSCTGDAIQCAIAKEQARRACELLGDGGSAVVALQEAGVAAGDNDLKPVGHPLRDHETVDLSISSRLDRTPLFGSNASCPADVPVPVPAFNQVIWFRFSEMCSLLNVLGAALQAVALIIALRIIFKGGL